MNIFDVTVSSFNGYKSTSTSQCTSLYDWLTSCDYKSEVDEIRSIKDKEVRRKLKSKLPAITPAGVFSNRRKGAKPITYSGFMCIDIDEHDNEHIRNFSALKEQLKNLLNVAYCGLSVSGRGFFLLIPIAYPEKYELHYDAFVENLSKLGINVDKSCRNISRLRGYSYDSKGYFNFNADTYYDLKFPSKPQLYSHYESDTTDDVDVLIMKICSHGIDITSNYKDWFAIGVRSLQNLVKREGFDFIILVVKVVSITRINVISNMTIVLNGLSIRGLQLAFFLIIANYME